MKVALLGAGRGRLGGLSTVTTPVSKGWCAHHTRSGSAGPRRFTLPATLSILGITGGTIEHTRIDLLA